MTDLCQTNGQRRPFPFGTLLLLWTGFIFSGLFFLPAGWRIFQKCLPWLALRAGWIALAATSLSLVAYMRFVQHRTDPAGLGRILLWVLGLGICLKLLCRYPVEPFHAAQYVVLALLAHRFFIRPKSGPGAWTVAVFYPLAVGAIDETLQRWIPGRVFDPKDMILNWISAIFGILLAVCLFHLYSGEKSKKSPKPTEREGECPATAEDEKPR